MALEEKIVAASLLSLAAIVLVFLLNDSARSAIPRSPSVLQQQQQEHPPLKVFLLAGQSNMQGHGYMSLKNEEGQYYNGTLNWMVETYPDLYGKLQTGFDEETNTTEWAVRKDVWISYNRQKIGDVKADMNQYGPLVPGYGGDPGQQDTQLGPELGFGWTIGDALEGQQILLLKVAWGGRSLAVDFRPPSSSNGTTGLYYESMIANTYRTLSRLSELFPGYSGRYEVAGFVWHQGWNDGCDRNMTSEYEYNLANLIRDVRHDLGIPNLPVSIAVSGFEGYANKTHPSRDAIVDAQFAVANATKYPEFAGTVSAVQTRGFERDPRPDSPGTQGYHWNNNCETYWLIGQAMAKAMVDMLKDSSNTPQSSLSWMPSFFRGRQVRTSIAEK